MSIGDVSVRSETGAEELNRIVRTVALVARLGEMDCRGWWGTRSFGAAGRVVLKQRLPRTWRMAALELDIAAAGNRHNDVIDRPNAVHLFSDNWPARRWASAWVAEQKTATPPDSLFEELETASIEWLVADLGEPLRRLDTSSRAVRVGSISRAELGFPATVANAVAELAAAYAGLKGGFAVPYLEVTS